ncbi:MAG: hypothetical protein R3B70_44815 [Polyangiaceae bacterium]
METIPCNPHPLIPARARRSVPVVAAWGALLGLAFVVACDGPATTGGGAEAPRGGQTAMNEWGPFVEGVTLSLELPEQVLAPGEPAPLAARLRNFGGGPIHVVVRSQWADYEVHVSRDGEGQLSPLPAVAQRREQGMEGRRISKEIPNREELREQIDLASWFDLTRPGRYRVVATRSFWKPEPEPTRDYKARSNELVFEVRGAASPAAAPGGAGTQP